MLTGAGRGFCAGGDVKGMAERGDRGFEERVESFRTSHRVPFLLRTISKVVIAMVNGPAAGAGFSIALACDLRIAARSAKMNTAFVNVGFSGDYGGSWSLTRLVGTAKARELYFMGEAIDAETAHRLGIVNWVADDDALRAETTRVPFATVLDLEAIHQTRCGLTDDHREARAAFVEKRKPVFKGR